METRASRYPIGIQSFEKLREGNYMYVDKTHHLRKLIEMGNPYFLSRPRRFGKSLFLSTIEAFFRGKKELFEGLSIAETETEWNVHAVLHLSLNAENYNSIEQLEKALNFQLTTWEEQYGIVEQPPTYSTRFITVIRKACEQTGHRVVVLIDEYDKPMLRNLHDEELLSQFRNLLTAFYTVLKDADQWLHFVLVTGVTKFAQMGIFSNLNQLKDISFDPRFTDICGMTWPEIKTNFAAGLNDLAESNNITLEQVKEELTRRYDGYCFEERQTERVYNPFSILKALSDKRFKNYWFASGTPTFLVEMLKQTDYDLRELEGYKVRSESLTDDRANVKNPIPMMYQSGYLTIKGYDNEFETYTLGFPNDEVKYGLLNFAVPFYANVSDSDTSFFIEKFVTELRQGQTADFLERLRCFFADFPYELSDRTERHYQVIFYLVFKLMGQFIESEVRSARGRADAVVKTKDYIYVFEFKLNGSAQAALQQIEDKGYLIPYQVDKRKLIKVGVDFNHEERNIGEYVIGE